LKEAEAYNLDTCGIDISSEATKAAKINSPLSEIVCNDAHDLKWADNHFDYITNIGSLEHFHDPDGCLREMKRVLKPAGLVCIMLPNLYYYRHIINKTLKNEDPTSYQEIERFASLKEWKQFLEKNGFVITRVHKYNKFNRSKAMVFIRSFLIPIYLSHHFVFMCRKGRI